MVFWHVKSKYSEARSSNAQDKIEANYKKKYELTEESLGKLHMFFSPFRVPKGLTWMEVQLAIALQKSFEPCWAKVTAYRGYRTTMTRSAFREMVKDSLKRNKR